MKLSCLQLIVIIMVVSLVCSAFAAPAKRRSRRVNRNRHRRGDKAMAMPNQILGQTSFDKIIQRMLRKEQRRQRKQQQKLEQFGMDLLKAYQLKAFGDDQ